MVLLQTFDWDSIPLQPSVFEMFISPELEYPMVCMGVRQRYVQYNAEIVHCAHLYIYQFTLSPFTKF